MKIILLGKVYSNTQPKGKLINNLLNLLLLLPPTSFIVFATDIEKELLFEGVNLIPLTSLDNLEPYNEILSLAQIGFTDSYEEAYYKHIAKTNPELQWIIDFFDEKNLLTHNFFVDAFAYKFNRRQAETLSSLKLHDFTDLEQCKNIMIKKGINRAFITLNKKGAYFFNKDESGILPAETITRRKIKEAGDAFVSGVIYGLLFSKNIDFLAKKGVEFSARYINKYLEDNFSFGNNLNNS